MTGAANAAITGNSLFAFHKPSNTAYAYPNGYKNAVGGQVVGYGFGPNTGNANHAVLWTADSPNGIDLDTPGLTSSVLRGTSGTQQVGRASGSVTGGSTHAMLWNGTAASMVDLNPAGYGSSAAAGTNGVQQVGSANLPGNTNTNAMLWTGTAASAVNLHPAGLAFSEALGLSTTQQVGVGGNGNAFDNFHAYLWSGTAASAVDLHPATRFKQSAAVAVNGGQQVGYGIYTTQESHALLWTGTAASVVDLNPTFYRSSYAVDTNGEFQVGFATPFVPSNSLNHAMLWNGTADSAIDLHDLLPGTYAESYATAIVDDTVYGWGTDTTGYHALVWTGVPEPTSLTLLVAGGVLLTRRKRV